MSNEWTTQKHVEAYLAKLVDMPDRQAGEATLLSEIPATTRRVLDLGCGDGHLLHLVLSKFPGAEGIGIDVSPPMLAKAKLRFQGEPLVTLLEHDLAHELPELGKFDCVVSSLAIHHCTDEQKRARYSNVYSLLEPGGVFCNLEHVSSPTDRVHERFLQEMGLTSADEDPSNKLLDVETQLRWLRELGFAHVDCYWKWRELALLIGFRPTD